jgi:hypothetical protein
MIYMWFTGINYYKLAVEKDRDSIFTTISHYARAKLFASVFAVTIFL